MLGLSRAQISRQVAGLEAQLGVQLVIRRTRTFGLSEAGRSYVERARAILADVGVAEQAAQPAGDDVAGLLRVTAPAALGRQVLGGLVASFMANHPRLRLSLDLKERFVDVEETGFDVLLAIRGSGDHGDARRLAPLPQALATSPAYLAAHGRPQVPGDLGNHRLLHCAGNGAEPRWSLRGAGGTESFAITPALRSNEPEALREAAIAGLGIALLPAFVLAASLVEGRLVRVLEGFEPTPLGLYAFEPAGRRPSHAAQAFVAYLAAEFTRRPPG
jgi:DNA-binding transcriptional LysR family regulator